MTDPAGRDVFPLPEVAAQQCWFTKRRGGGGDAPIDTYWSHSPLSDVHEVTTPTLFLVGENDARVPMPQSVEMYRALRHHGVPTHLHVAPRESHGWEELRHRLFKANVELAWFERWVRDRDYEWETAPVDDGPHVPRVHGRLPRPRNGLRRTGA